MSLQLWKHLSGCSSAAFLLCKIHLSKFSIINATLAISSCKIGFPLISLRAISSMSWAFLKYEAPHKISVSYSSACTIASSSPSSSSFIIRYASLISLFPYLKYWSTKVTEFLFCMFFTSLITSAVYFLPTTGPPRVGASLILGTSPLLIFKIVI